MIGIKPGGRRPSAREQQHPEEQRNLHSRDQKSGDSKPQGSDRNPALLQRVHRKPDIGFGLDPRDVDAQGWA